MSRAAPALSRALRVWSGASLLALIALCLAWELWLAPLRPGGSWLVLKVFPLLLPLAGVLKGSVYTMQWASMLVLLYLAEGVVRATGERWPSSGLAALEVALSLGFFAAAVFYVRPAKRAARRDAKAEA